MEDSRGHSCVAQAWLAALACVATLLLPATAGAHDGHQPLSDKDEAAIGDHVTPVDDGLYRVPIGGGESLVTHGPDPASARLASRVAGGVFGPNGSERTPNCATDYHQHVLVGHLAGAPDRVAEVRGNVRQNRT